MNDLVIDIKNLSRRFGDKHALQDVTLRVPRGGVFGLIGSNDVVCVFQFRDLGCTLSIANRPLDLADACHGGSPCNSHAT